MAIYNKLVEQFSTIGIDIEAQLAQQAKDNIQEQSGQRVQERQWKASQRKQLPSLFKNRQARANKADTEKKDQANASNLLGRALAGLNGTLDNG